MPNVAMGVKTAKALVADTSSSTVGFFFLLIIKLALSCAVYIVCRGIAIATPGTKTRKLALLEQRVEILAEQVTHRDRAIKKLEKRNRQLASHQHHTARNLQDLFSITTELFFRRDVRLQTLLAQKPTVTLPPVRMLRIENSRASHEAPTGWPPAYTTTGLDSPGSDDSERTLFDPVPSRALPRPNGTAMWGSTGNAFPTSVLEQWFDEPMDVASAPRQEFIDQEESEMAHALIDAEINLIMTQLDNKNRRRHGRRSNRS